MFCKYCGAKIADDSVFCASCGKSLLEKETPAEESQSVHQENNSIPEDKPVASETVSPEKQEWYYRGEEHKICGPLTYAEVLEDISLGDLDPDYEVKPAGSNTWIPIMSSVFASKVPAKPETMTVYVFDKYVWCLAIVPLLVMMIIEKIGLANSIGDFLWIVSFGLNTLFLVLDKNELSKTGTDVLSRWWFIGILLVPIYLLVREIKTNHNFCPFIIWCFLFAVSIFIL